MRKDDIRMKKESIYTTNQKSHKLEVRHYILISKLHEQIQRCKNAGDLQVVSYSAHYGALTQVCFTCGMVRTTIRDEQIYVRSKVI